MSKKQRFTHYYDLNGLTIIISSNNHDRLSSIASYLSLPRIDKPAQKAAIELTIDIVPQAEADHLMPLPDSTYRDYESTLLLERPIPYAGYCKERSRWVDYQNLGRTRFEENSTRIYSIIYNNHGIKDIYLDIIYGYNLILSRLNSLGYLAVHASCCSVNGKGLLFTGVSGRGKSTAAYALLRRGHHILADDRILLRKEECYRAYSISDVIKLGAEPLHYFFPELNQSKPLHQVNDDYYFKISASAHFAYQHKVAVDGLFIFERIIAGKSYIEEINPARVIGEMFPVTLVDFNPVSTARKFDFLIDLLSQVRCFKIFFGPDMKDFASAVEIYADQL